MPKLGIRAYLLIVLGVLTVLPTLVLSTITADRASESERERAGRDGRARARAVARELDQFMSIQTASIELLAGQVEAAGGLDAPRLQELLSTHRRHSRGLEFVYIANRDGLSLITDPPFNRDGAPNAGTSYHDRDYYVELMRTGRTTISRVQLGRRSGVPNLQVVAPIHDGAQGLIGFAEGSIDLDGIAESVSHAVQGAPDSRVIVTDGYGRVLADSSGRLGVLDDISRLPILQGPAGETAHHSSKDERGTRVRVATARTSQELGWTVSALRDQSSVEALADAARRDALVITAIAVVLALLVVGFGVHLLAKPIRALAATTKAVGHGDFSSAVPPPRAFEVSELAELLVSVRDMTRDVERKRDEATALITELETVNDQLRTMVVGIEHAGNAIEVVDAAGCLMYVNAAWEKFTGYTAAEAIGTSFVEMLSVDRTFTVDVWGQLREGTAWRGIYPSRRRNGKLVEVELNAVPVVRADGALSHVVATRIDISEQRRAEEVLRMNDRLVAVGTLAAGVAHEINNPLAYISANLDYLRSIVRALSAHLPAAELEDALASFDETRVGIDRVTTIVRDLRQLSRPDEHTTSIVDLNALLDSCLRMARLEIKGHTTVTTAFGEIPRIDGNEARLSQVFLNLLINAAQACSGSQRATSSIRVVTSAAANHASVVVEISDDGKGIEPEDLEHIFDAFFTTKPIGVGTGLGLSICHGIVTQLGGTITVDSTPNVGSTFRVTLPVTAARRATTAPVIIPQLARTRILIVDDEPGITSALVRMLHDHDVTAAGSAAEALALIAAAPFDVVVTDIMMPDIDGFELCRRATEADPQYTGRFIFMTGGIAQRQLRDRLEHVAGRCLYKPFSHHDAQAAIATVLEAERGRSAAAGANERDAP